jgi:hypothetical protein
VSSITPEATRSGSVWINVRSWTEPGRRIDQAVETRAYGAPEDPADLGRTAVDRHADDLRRLSES